MFLALVSMRSQKMCKDTKRHTEAFDHRHTPEIPLQEAIEAEDSG